MRFPPPLSCPQRASRVSKPLLNPVLYCAVALSLCAFVAFASAPPPSNPSSPNPGFLGGNRHSVMGVDQAGLAPGGVFPLDSANRLASVRFQSAGRRTIEKVWLFYRTVGSPGMFRLVILEDDGNGQPVTTPSNSFALFAPHPPAALGGWHEIVLPPGHEASIEPGGIYHLVIQASGPVDADNRIELITARSRFAVPFFRHAGLATAALGSSPFDFNAFLFDDDALTGNGLLVQREPHEAFTPIFLLECDLGLAVGQPYDRYGEFGVDGAKHFGQLVSVDRPTKINWVAMFVRGWGTHGDPVPADDLYLSILRVDGSSESTVYSGVLAPRTSNLTRGRSHWVAQYIPDLLLEPGSAVRYYFVLSSPISERGRGYVFSLSDSTLPLPPWEIPTYRTVRSVAIASFDGGASYQAVSATADAPFMYGFFEPQTPLALNDEVNGTTTCPGSGAHFPLTAKPGELVSFQVTNRNVGAPSVSSEIYASLVHADTGQVLVRATYPSLDTNTETPTPLGNQLEFVMPGNDLRLILETGHMVGTRALPDDWTALEIRVDLDCP